MLDLVVLVFATLTIARSVAKCFDYAEGLWDRLTGNLTPPKIPSDSSPQPSPKKESTKNIAPRSQLKTSANQNFPVSVIKDSSKSTKDYNLESPEIREEETRVEAPKKQEVLVNEERKAVVNNEVPLRSQRSGSEDVGVKREGKSKSTQLNKLSQDGIKSETRPPISNLCQSQRILLEGEQDRGNPDKLTQSFFQTFHQIESSKEQMRQKVNRSREQYEEQIGHLRHQIEQLKREKKTYVQRIDEIIQHVVKEGNVGVVEDSQEIVNSQELQAINPLKAQLNQAHEKQKNLHQSLKKQISFGKKQIYEDQEVKIKPLQELAQPQQESLSRFIEEKKKQQITNQSGILQPLKLLQLQIRHETQLQTVRSENLANIRLASQKQNQLKEANQRADRLQLQLQDRQLELRNERENKQKRETQLASLRQKVQQLQKQLITLQIELTDRRLREQNGEKQFKQILEEQAINRLKDLQELLRQKSEEAKKQKLACQEFEKRLGDVQEQLKFCQLQIAQSQKNERQLKEELQLLRSSPKRGENSPIKNEDVLNHPQYLKIKEQLKEYQVKDFAVESPKGQDNLIPIQKKINYAKVNREREVSPSFKPLIAKETTSPSSSQTRGLKFERQKVQSVVSPVSSFPQKSGGRSNTPIERPTIHFASQIHQTDVFFGQSSILVRQKREYLLREINNVKRITVKKTKLLYRSQAKNSRQIYDYVSSVPNLLVVVELANTKLVAAFTQSAFSRELTSFVSPDKSKYVSQNKALLIDLSNERVIQNQKSAETIRYDPHALIWGHNEFVVNCEQPLLLQCDLNCEGAVYPDEEYSTGEFVGGNGGQPIAQFEIFRVYMG